MNFNSQSLIQDHFGGNSNLISDAYIDKAMRLDTDVVALDQSTSMAEEETGNHYHPLVFP